MMFNKPKEMTFTKLPEPDYEGMAKVIDSMAKLYPLTEDHKTLNTCLEKMFNPGKFFVTFPPDQNKTAPK